MGLLFWRKPRLPVIELHGVLSTRPGSLNLESCGPAIDAAFAATGKRKVVVLDIDSPGGSPVQSDLIAQRIRHRAERDSVRVLAVVAEVGASGGYWLACAADEILASPMSIVGSIGVVGGGFGFVELLRRVGVERRLYTAGENKRRLDPFSPERPEDLRFVRDLMTDIHGRFKDWVRVRRGARLGDEATVFDGSFFLGDRALTLGLIDRIGTRDSLLRELAGEKPRIRCFRPKRRRGLLARLPRLLAETASEAVEQAASQPLIRVIEASC